MSDPDPKPDLHRPGPTPFANRIAPPAPRNTLTGLLSRSGGATPIPPGLQAKMAAVSQPSVFPLI